MYDDVSPQVVSIDLSENTISVTDGVVGELAALVPSMEVLELQGCTQITDDSLEALAEHALDLTVIDLTGCTGITFAGVAALADGCTELVEVVGCGMVLNDDMLEDLLPFNPTDIERFQETPSLAAYVLKSDGAADAGGVPTTYSAGGAASNSNSRTSAAGDVVVDDDNVVVDDGGGGQGGQAVMRIPSEDLLEADLAIRRADSSEDYDITRPALEVELEPEPEPETQAEAGVDGDVVGANDGGDDGGDSNQEDNSSGQKSSAEAGSKGGGAEGKPHCTKDAADNGDAKGESFADDNSDDDDDDDYVDQLPTVQLDLRKELWGKTIIVTPAVVQRCLLLQDMVIAHLDLRGNDFVFDEVLEAFAEQCHAVWVVDIEYCDAITAAGVASLATKCAGLRYVTG